MDPAERRFLEGARRGFLATADADGRPAAVPVCFALVEPPSVHAAGDRGEVVGPPWLATPLDEKPKEAEPRELRRVRDVAANPRVALVVDRYDPDWTTLAWVQVRGTARLLEQDDDGHGDAVAALAAKYDQYAGHALGERPLLRVDPGHVVSWGALDEGPGASRQQDL